VPIANILLAEVKSYTNAANTHRFHAIKMSDINLIHGHEILEILQVNVQLDDLAEI
jgi:hypothetical protein